MPDDVTLDVFLTLAQVWFRNILIVSLGIPFMCMEKKTLDECLRECVSSSLPCVVQEKCRASLAAPERPYFHKDVFSFFEAERHLYYSTVLLLVVAMS